MKIEIEVGEYVRTNEGEIGIIETLDMCSICEEIVYVVDSNYQGKIYHKNNIANHSKDIIDLIEVGDIIELEDISESVVPELKKRIYWLKDEEDIKEIFSDDCFKLKSILTHEQYERNCYRLEE